MFIICGCINQTTVKHMEPRSMGSFFKNQLDGMEGMDEDIFVFIGEKFFSNCILYNIC